MTLVKSPMFSEAWMATFNAQMGAPLSERLSDSDSLRLMVTVPSAGTTGSTFACCLHRDGHMELSSLGVDPTAVPVTVRIAALRLWAGKSMGDLYTSGQIFQALQVGSDGSVIEDFAYRHAGTLMASAVVFPDWPAFTS